MGQEKFQQILTLYLVSDLVDTWRLVISLQELYGVTLETRIRRDGGTEDGPTQLPGGTNVRSGTISTPENTISCQTSKHQYTLLQFGIINLEI